VACTHPAPRTVLTFGGSSSTAAAVSPSRELSVSRVNVDVTNEGERASATAEGTVPAVAKEKRPSAMAMAASRVESAVNKATDEMMHLTDSAHWGHGSEDAGPKSAPRT
jgi:hypothetical protein